MTTDRLTVYAKIFDKTKTTSSSSATLRQLYDKANPNLRTSNTLGCFKHLNSKLGWITIDKTKTRRLLSAISAAVCNC